MASVRENQVRNVLHLPRLGHDVEEGSVLAQYACALEAVHPPQVMQLTMMANGMEGDGESGLASALPNAAQGYAAPRELQMAYAATAEDGSPLEPSTFLYAALGPATPIALATHPGQTPNGQDGASMYSALGPPPAWSNGSAPAPIAAYADTLGEPMPDSPPPAWSNGSAPAPIAAYADTLGEPMMYDNEPFSTGLGAAAPSAPFFERL
ncbi:uncharacterized protein AMSG_12413 [Thecamonas trahens ATCC 50062]|uniref:Uncharacterized protein n=1 Tax=Thecamonas trahens ATCC 50062 TaxID=461836 RepID=A0A0L0DT27_THETB|nr:hypothetical protein AMSG_12413 [Thecamonas trahens ATCC 50062]KNC55425.1 hypothetical protein AMSG_12413 [Thecamonas trahens ATCC 50062]|eukprot:XP_013752992.1 hypothetical protein AMSG_12413 [Thecamonas trahens ATCC 50062]